MRETGKKQAAEPMFPSRALATTMPIQVDAQNPGGRHRRRQRIPDASGVGRLLRRSYTSFSCAPSPRRPILPSPPLLPGETCGIRIARGAAPADFFIGCRNHQPKIMTDMAADRLLA